MTDAENAWAYTVRIPHAPIGSPPDVVTERIKNALLGAGYMKDGNAPDVALASMDDTQVTVMVNSDLDPTAFLQQLGTIPTTPQEQDTSNLKAQLVQYRDAVKAGTAVTTTQTAKAVAALITILQQENQA
jgi:hypothetical protein